MARRPGQPNIHADGFTTPDRRRRIDLAILLAALTALGLGLVLSAPQADAKQKFLSGFAQAYPAAAGTPLDSCLLCHTDPVRPRESNLNNYGEDWEDGDLGDKDYLAPNLVNRDSDGDGVPNGQEILQLSLPGDPSSSTTPTTTTTVPGTPPDGQALYAARCAACHGPNGGDLSGTNLGRSTFITITINGQGSMPAQSISDQEAGAIWDYVTGTAPPTTPTTLPGATTTTTAPLSGSVVWAQQCSVCHGADGGNVVPTSSSRSLLVSVITNGIGSMRGFPELGSAQIGNVADYLLGFGSPATTTTLPGATTTTTVPRSGAAVYAASCAMCHGPEAANLQGHDLSRSRIASITANGVGIMRGYADSLSSAEIENVSGYVASFGALAGAPTTTPAVGSPISGSTLYMQNCSGCHGLHGAGGPGGAVAGSRLSRSAIVSLVEVGTSGMPAYGSRLSSAEIDAIADHILAMSSGGGGDDGNLTGDAVTAAGEPSITPGIAVGHALYGRLCASCHGEDGEGGLGGPVVGSRLSVADLSAIIRGGGSSMPAFAGQMSDTELQELVLFTEALASGADTAMAMTDEQQSEKFAAGSSPGVPPPAGTGSDGVPSTPVVMAVLLGFVIAGGAALLWIRSVRYLIG